MQDIVYNQGTAQEKPSIIIDIDGTLSDPSHRRHHVEQGREEWEEFFAKVVDDPVNNEIRKIASKFWLSHNVIIVTGRPEKSLEGANIREKTLDWLMEHNVPFDRLVMRKEKDLRPDTTVKQEILDEKLPEPGKILFAIDDRTDIAELWRENGITCLQLEDNVEK